MKNVVLVFFLINFYISQTITIYGLITDKKSGEAIIGANVFIENTEFGSYSDKNGFYSITIDNYNPQEVLVIQYVGYATIEKQMILLDNNENSINIARKRENFQLEASSLELEVEQITGEQESRQTVNPYSSIKVTQSQLSALPSLAEADIFRALQSLPGVLQASEFSTGLIIRGGNTDQNLILLDGITVYNPSHLGGVFSNFIVEAIKEANLTKGGFNAEYGGRLSAVLDVISREGNRNKFKFKSDISLLSAKATAEGPFYNVAWLISGRRTYFDKVFEAIGYDGVPPYYFYDIQGHAFTDLSYKDRLSISFYNGIDDFEYGPIAIQGDWGNKTHSIKYRRLFNEKLIGNFLLAKSKFFVNFGLGGSSGINEEDIINDQTFSGNFSYFLNNDITIKTGYQYKKLKFSYQSFFDDSTLFSLINAPNEWSLYSQAKFVLNDNWVIEPGIRLNYYETMYPNLRLGLKYIIQTDEFINLSIGNYDQFMFTFQDDFNPPLLDAWVAIDESVNAGKAEHVVLGYEKYFNDYRFQLEGYYKNIYNMLTFEDQRASTDGEVSSEQLSDILTASDGEAGGIELFIQKLKGDLTGWLAYTLSYSIKEMNGQTYFTNWDRRHVLNFVGNKKLKWLNLFNQIKLFKEWNFNWKFTYQSGQAHTPILGYYLEDMPDSQETLWRSIPGGRNSARYPDYHRLDLGLSKDFKISKNVKGKFFMQVINAYNRKNIFRYFYTTQNIIGVDDDGDWNWQTDDIDGNGEAGYYWDVESGEWIPEPNVDEPDENIPQRRELSIFPIIPTIGFSIEL